MGATDEKKIWDMLMAKIKNPYGVAGLMGNLFAESSLNPLCKTGGDKSVSGQEYAARVDSGEIGREIFMRDGVAFGLVQWRYWSRKEQLWLYWDEEGRRASIGSVDIQVQFMLKELPAYKTVWSALLNTKSVREASDVVMLRYEKPGTVTKKAKEKRAEFGMDYYNKYAEEVTPVGDKYVRTTANNVNLRRGNGKNYSAAGQVPYKGTKLKWVATAENGWHAVECTVRNKAKEVAWVSPDFSEIAE